MVMGSELKWEQRVQAPEQALVKVTWDGMPRAPWHGLRTNVLGELVGSFHQGLTEELLGGSC